MHYTSQHSLATYYSVYCSSVTKGLPIVGANTSTTEPPVVATTVSAQPTCINGKLFETCGPGTCINLFGQWRRYRGQGRGAESPWISKCI